MSTRSSTVRIKLSAFGKERLLTYSVKNSAALLMMGKFSSDPLRITIRVSSQAEIDATAARVTRTDAARNRQFSPNDTRRIVNRGMSALIRMNVKPLVNDPTTDSTANTPTAIANFLQTRECS